MTAFDDTSYLWKVSLDFAENGHILAWWGEAQDETLTRLIDEFAWLYPWHISDAIVAITSDDVAAAWREQDPACQRYAWYNVLMYFGVARARTTGLEHAMRPPETLNCLRCKTRFRQDEVGASTARKLGKVSNIRYCQACCSAAFAGGSDLDDLRLSDAAIADWIRDVASLTGLIPPQDFFNNEDFLEAVSGDTARTQLLGLAARRPTAKRIKDAFGSWLNALAVAGVLPDGAHHTRRGVRSVAADGHVCLSLPERTIDDWLSAYGLDHEKEPRYPDSNYRGDWRVGGSIIEFFGLAGNPDYDARIQEKRELAERHGIDLIEVYPKDMLKWGATQEWLATRLGIDLAARERRILPTQPQALSDTKPAIPKAPPVGPAEGWYADPTGREASRWWDGRYWTQLVLDASGDTYSDTPYPERDDPVNHGSEIEGQQTWEFLSSTKLPWPGKPKGAELVTHLELMFRCMDAVENAARRDGYGTSPGAYSEAAGHLRHARNHAGEAAILARALQTGLGPGAGRRDISTRMAAIDEAGVHPNPVESGMTAHYPPPET
ncbi:DUF2510 domain-containing protein [Janibacter limosus]|uniref:DUF2510 domain-containing protein n=1 Tax=Janibacter limosus TaxID=53458 RepID=UPI000A52BE62|nr:DUF2510 domain-containing protein [Janibacter limosus]